MDGRIGSGGDREYVHPSPPPHAGHAPGSSGVLLTGANRVGSQAQHIHKVGEAPCCDGEGVVCVVWWWK